MRMIKLTIRNSENSFIYVNPNSIQSLREFWDMQKNQKYVTIWFMGNSNQNSVDCTDCIEYILKEIQLIGE